MALDVYKRQVEVLPRMPLTSNGKCDYAALKELP